MNVKLRALKRGQTQDGRMVEPGTVFDFDILTLASDARPPSWAEIAPDLDQPSRDECIEAALADPGFASRWLEGWLLGRNTGVGDPQAIAMLRPGSSGDWERLRMEDLGCPDVLSAESLANVIRSIRRHHVGLAESALLSRALGHIRRDFGNLAGQEPLPKGAEELFWDAVESIEGARNLLIVRPVRGSLRPGDKITGWDGMAVAARAIIASALRRDGHSAAGLPSVPQYCDSLGELRAYWAELQQSPMEEVTTKEVQRGVVIGEPAAEHSVASGPTLDIELGKGGNWLRIGEQRFLFSKGQQARAVEALYEEWERAGRADGCGLSQEEIGAAVGSSSDGFRMDTLFRGHPAWKTVIRSPRKGVYALYLTSPEAESQQNSG